MRILAVCMGNICRSPAAEAAIREAALREGVDIEVDSAGTGSWHVGEPPNPRMVRAARAEGLAVGGRARQVTPEDFGRFDLIVVMDRDNLNVLRALAPDTVQARKIRLFREFDPDAGSPDVPDPYYGPDQGFTEVVRMVRPAAAGLIAAIRDSSVDR